VPISRGSWRKVPSMTASSNACSSRGGSSAKRSRLPQGQATPRLRRGRRDLDVRAEPRDGWGSLRAVKPGSATTLTAMGRCQLRIRDGRSVSRGISLRGRRVLGPARLAVVSAFWRNSQHNRSLAGLPRIPVCVGPTRPGVPSLRRGSFAEFSQPRAQPASQLRRRVFRSPPAGTLFAASGAGFRSLIHRPWHNLRSRLQTQARRALAVVKDARRTAPQGRPHPVGMPAPDYDDFIQEFGARRPDGGIVLSFETSTGCWWGEKSH